jgi:hypothetical protein
VLLRIIDVGARGLLAGLAAALAAIDRRAKRCRGVRLTAVRPHHGEGLVDERLRRRRDSSICWTLKRLNSSRSAASLSA